MINLPDLSLHEWTSLLLSFLILVYLLIKIYLLISDDYNKYKEEMKGKDITSFWRNDNHDKSKDKTDKN